MPQTYTNVLKTAPLEIYNAITAPKLAGTSKKTSDLNQLKSNHESESLIRNAPDSLIHLTATSRYHGKNQGDSSIRNAFLSTTGTNDKIQKKEEKIKRTEPVKITTADHRQHYTNENRNFHSVGTSRPHSPLNHATQNHIPKQPIKDKDEQITSLTKPSASAPVKPNPLKSIIHSTDTLKTSRNMGSRIYELINCERTAHRSPKHGERQLSQIQVLHNVIVENQPENSNIQIPLPVPKNKIHNSSKAIIRTSLQKQKYNFQNNNNTNYRSNYTRHTVGVKYKNKNNSSQRKIREDRKCTDQGKCISSIVPPPYVSVKKSKSFQNLKRSPETTVSRSYLRENKKTISDPKISKVPQSYLRPDDSNKKYIHIPYKDTSIHETTIPITIGNLSPQQKYFSLVHTVASRTIPVETISDINLVLKP